MLKLITFDIGKTIINTSGRSKLKSIEEITGIQKDIFKNDYKEIFCTSKMPLEIMIEKFCNKYNLQEYENIEKIFLEKSKFEINAEIEELIVFLYNKGYKIATLSNACFWTYTKIEDTRISKFIDKEFYSFDIGYVKPNPKIFEEIQKYYKVLPNEILHIGDSINSDYKAALKCGWNAFLLEDNVLQIYQFINNLIKGGETL